MRKYLRWCSLPIVAGVAFVLASCGDENVPTAIQEATTPTVTETETPAETIPLAEVVTLATPAYNCMGDIAATPLPNDPKKTYVQGMGVNQPYDLNCTANDVVIALADVKSCVGCSGGTGTPTDPYT